MQPPKAKKIPYIHETHGDVRHDDYFWLRDRHNPQVIEYLQAENSYYEEMVKPLASVAESLYQGMASRIPKEELEVPVQDGLYFYYSRMQEELPYPTYARKRADHRDQLADSAEEILLDLNAIAKDGEYLNVTVLRVSPNDTQLAYLENRDGTDRYTLQVKDLTTGEWRTAPIANVCLDESVEWDESGGYLFYVTVDESQRPFQLWRRQLDSQEADVLLYEETDITFSLALMKSASGKYLFVKSHSTTTDEIRYLPAQDPLQPLTLMDARRRGIRYSVEHWGSDFLFLTNEGAPNFRILRCAVDDLSSVGRVELIPYDEHRSLQAVMPFREGLVISGRENGITQIWRYVNDELTKLSWDESIYTVAMAGNRSYDSSELLIKYESLVTPRTTFAVDLKTGAKQVLQEASVSGDYNRTLYKQERIWSKAEDGTEIPTLMVYRVNALGGDAKPGHPGVPAPLILYAYGAYGSNTDPEFDPYRIPLLDMGVVCAFAQVRGGSEMGEYWYEDGKVLHKRNTFDDFIAVAQDLVARNYTTPRQLAAVGASAGGLLVASVAQMAPELFQVVYAGVPFVDVISTMLDATIPLTSLEWDEWGNPQNPEHYAYMKTYSPYDNVTEQAYPHMLVTTGLNDPRVAYWEPAKWVARLRTTKTDEHALLLKTNMDSGHFGSSGRFSQLKEQADHYAFLLDKLGV